MLRQVAIPGASPATWASLPVWLARLAALATLGALTIAALAYLAPVQRIASLADLVTPLLGHVLIGGASAALALWWKRHEIVIMTAGVALALLVHPALSFALQPRALWPVETAAAAPGPLRVYALNSWDENTDLPRLERALDIIGADVIVLVEADASKLPMIARLKSRFPHQVSCAARYECATAILSRLPIVASSAARPRNEVPPIAWARIDVSARGLGVVTIVGTHVHRPTRSARLHTAQMQALTAIVAGIKGPLIVAGDFNTGAWSASYNAFLHTTGLTPFATLVPTWPAYPVVAPQVALDHILVSRELAVTRSGAGPATGSDHLPVFAEITAK